MNNTYMELVRSKWRTFSGYRYWLGVYLAERQKQTGGNIDRHVKKNPNLFVKGPSLVCVATIPLVKCM